jgi:hypothetical protein
VLTELTFANELDPLPARYTLYPVTGTLEPVGAFQFKLTCEALPVPLRLTVAVALVDELLVTVSCPLAEPVVVGLNVKATFSVCPGLSVAGKLTAGAENPLPVTAIEFTVTGAVPLEVRVTVCVVEPFTATPPNDTLLTLRLSVGIAALSCSETDFEELPVVAVTEADCALLTEEIFAVNAAFVAAAGTVTEPGVVTAELLLVSATLRPPDGAEPDKLTVHESANAPVTEVLLQLIPLTVGATVVPVPLRLTAAAETLLEIDNCPVDEFALVGSN